MNAVEGIKPPNANEAVFFKRDLPTGPVSWPGKRFRGVNRWPADLPGFREAALDLPRAMEDLGRRLVRCPAAALGLPARAGSTNEFPASRCSPCAWHPYPRQPPRRPTNGDCHADTSFMTILAQNGARPVAAPAGRPLDRRAGAEEGAFLVNGGVDAAALDQPQLPGHPHRVTNRSGQERYAIPFFMDCPTTR